MTGLHLDGRRAPAPSCRGFFLGGFSSGKSSVRHRKSRIRRPSGRSRHRDHPEPYLNGPCAKGDEPASRFALSENQDPSLRLAALDRCQLRPAGDPGTLPSNSVPHLGAARLEARTSSGAGICRRSKARSRGSPEPEAGSGARRRWPSRGQAARSCCPAGARLRSMKPLASLPRPAGARRSRCWTSSIAPRWKPPPNVSGKNSAGSTS